MADRKHWFDEEVAVFEPCVALSFDLTACNFPISRLRHSYSFIERDGRTRVTQVMDYTPKFGPLGRLLDALVIRRNSQRGIEAFFGGLKGRAELPDTRASATSAVHPA